MISWTQLPYADFVTTITHKTLRMPRGGTVKYEKAIDKIIFQGILFMLSTIYLFLLLKILALCYNKHELLFLYK